MYFIWRLLPPSGHKTPGHWSRGSDNIALTPLLSRTDHLQYPASRPWLANYIISGEQENQLDTDCGSQWQRGSSLFTTQHFSHNWDSSLTREESVQQITSSPSRECKTQLITDCRLSHEKPRHMQHSEINPESRIHPSQRLEYPGLRSQGYCCCSSLGSFLCPSSSEK